MAVQSDALTVEVVLDTKGAVKGFRGLHGEVTSLDKAIAAAEKEMLNAGAAMGEMGQAAAVSSDNVTKLAVATTSANASAREFSQSQSKISSAFDAASKGVTTMATAVSGLHDAYALLTSNETLSRISKLLRVSALLADVKGYDKMADRLREASDKVVEFGVANDQASQKVDEALTKYADLDRTIEGVRDSVSGLLVTSAAIASLPFLPAILAQTKATADLGKAVWAAGGNFKAAEAESRSFVSSLGNFKTAGVEAGKGILETAKSSKIVASLIARDFFTAAQEVRKFGEVAKNLGKVGILSLAEASLSAGSAIGALGAILATFDSTTAKVAGGILVVAAALTGAFGVAVNMALNWIGRLIESIGDKLITSMTAFEEKALKLQSVMHQFTFTVKGFNRVYGRDAVGSLELWQGALEKTVETTTFARAETAKAIKLMVAEGKTLGLSVKDTTALFERSKDIAAATGNALDDVVQQLISGLSGNSQAVLNLGINTTEAALNQLELVKATGQTVSALSDQDKIMARLQEVFTATKPIAGAAALAVTTVAGAYAMLDKRLTEVQARLGEQGAFTTAYLVAFSKIAEAFLSLPPSVLDTLGTLQDFLGVLFKVIGVTLQAALTLTALSTAYHLLSGAVAKYAIVQTGLTSLFGMLGGQLGAQTIAVTTIANVWTNLAVVLRAGVAAAFTAAGSVILAFGKGLLSVVAGVAPLLFAMAQIGVVIYGVIEGFRMVERETKIFSTAMATVGTAFGLVGKGTKDAANSLNVITQAVKNFTTLLVGVGTLLVTSFVGVLNDVSLVLLKVSSVLVSFSATTKATVDGAIESIQENSDKLANTSKRAIAVLVSLGASTALAGSNMNQGASAADRYAVSLRGATNASEAMLQVTREMEVARVQSNDAQALVLERQLLQLKFMTEQEGQAKQDIATQIVRNQAALGKTFDDAIKAAKRATDETRKKLVEGATDGGSIRELIAIRKRLEGDATREQIIKLKLVADEGGASEAIKRLQDELGRLYDSIEEEEMFKFAAAISAPKIEASAKAMEGLSQATQALAKSLESARVDFEAMAAVKGFDPGSVAAAKDSGTGEELMKQYKLIELEKQRAILAGANVRLAEERASKAVEAALTLSKEVDGLERLKGVREAIKAAEDAAEGSLKAMRAQRMTDNETLLRFGMNRKELADRELEIEIDKIDALERQIKAAGKLDRFAQAELDLARKTAEQKNVLARAPTPGSAESAPVIGGAAAAVGPAGGIAAGPVGGFMAAAEMIVAAVQKLIDFIPNIINAVGKIFSSIADLPNMILGAVKNLMGSIVKFTSEFIPNLFSAIPEIIDTVLTALFETIPEAAQKVIESIPSLIDGLIKRIPDLVAKLVSGLVSSSVTIAIGLITAIIQNLPSLIKNIVFFMPVIAFALVKGIVKGLMSAIKNIASAFGHMFKGGGKTIANAAKAVGNAISGGLKKLTGVKGSLFGFGDDVKNTKAADVGKSLLGDIKEAGKNASNLLAKAWELLKKAWQWVYDTLLAPFVNLFKSAFSAIADTFRALWDIGKRAFAAVFEIGRQMFSIVGDVFKAVFDFVKTSIFDPFISILQSTWQFIKDGIIAPIITAFQGVWDFVKSMFGGVIDTFKALWNFVKTLFDDPVKAFQNLWADLKAIFSNVFSAFDKLFSSISSALSQAFSAIGTFFSNAGSAIWNGLKTAWENGIGALTNIGDKIWSSITSAWGSIGDLLGDVGGAVWKSITGAFSGIGEFFKGIFEKLDVSNLLGKLFKLGKMDKDDGAVEKFLHLEIPWVEFARGGKVPGKANVFGDSSANDIVPALLSPGEAVIPRSLMQDPAVSKLVGSLLAGKPVGQHADGWGVVKSFVTGGLSNTSAGEKVEEKVRTIADDAGDWFKGLSGPAKIVFDLLKKFAGSIDLVKAFKNPLGYAKDLFQKFAQPILTSMMDKIKGMLSTNAGKPDEGGASGSIKIKKLFAQGGMVPGIGTGDTVPSLLSPGEFVMKRSAADAIGFNTLSAMNASGRIPTSGGSGGDVTVNIENITTSQPIDRDFVKRTLVPAVKEELKTASLRGEFLLSQRGIRSGT